MPHNKKKCVAGTGVAVVVNEKSGKGYCLWMEIEKGNNAMAVWARHL